MLACWKKCNSRASLVDVDRIVGKVIFEDVVLVVVNWLMVNTR